MRPGAGRRGLPARSPAKTANKGGGTSGPSSSSGLPPQTHVLPDFQVVGALVDLGWKALREHAHGAAEYILREAVRLNPQDGRAHLGIARLCQLDEDYGPASSASMLAAEINPWSAEAWFAVANNFFLMNTRVRRLVLEVLLV
jgi:Tfp pilus assembly protein PilF